LRRVSITAAVAAVVAWPPAASGQDPPERLPDGAAIAAVPVGGLDRAGAEREVRRALALTWGRRIRIGAGRWRRGVGAADAGAVIHYVGMVRTAFGAAARGEPVDVPLDMTIDETRVERTVRQTAADFYRRPRSARVRFGIERVKRRRHRAGRAIDATAFREALLAELNDPHPPGRLVRARVRRLRPEVTTSELGRRHPTFVSIDRGAFKLRLFKRLHLVRTYPVAVGAGGYETPRGIHHVLSREVNPAWHAPNRPWAGALAGQTIPPGDPRNPLKARFIGLGGGVGIHGTSEEWSIGTRASHGCIRMRVRDVVRLYPKVPLGTPVLIR
jgi:lipoprotein-anchoring transpeptidase ErfK/SrfK